MLELIIINKIFFLDSDKGNQYDKNSLLAETQLMGYEQGELLSCIDNGQLPAVLAEQLETNHSHLFYDGCIVAEVRDYRRSFLHNKADVHHVLLKPTTQVTFDHYVCMCICMCMFVCVCK